ncbi:MAG: SdrD B-like domain-containing protein [Planctomycetota bacterium]
MGEIRLRSLRAGMAALGLSLLAGSAVRATELSPNPELQLQAPGLSFVIGGVGLRDAQAINDGNTLTVSTPRLARGADTNLSLPVDGPIQAAFIYWGGRGTVLGDEDILIDDQLVKGTLIGTEFTRTDPGLSDPPQEDGNTIQPSAVILAELLRHVDIDDGDDVAALLPNTTAYIYGADVTELIAGSFMPPGEVAVMIEDPTPGDESSELDGASLLIIYSDPNDTRSYRISVWEGCDFAYAPRLPDDPGFTTPVNFMYGAAAADRTAELAIVVGDSTPDRPDRIEITANPDIVNPFDASDGAQWDTDQFTFNIPAGAESTVVECVSPPEAGVVADSLIWSLAVFRAPCDSAIGDRIWEDLNGNGIQDDGEPGLPNIPVQLFLDTQPDPTFLDETMTDLNGDYLFAGLCSGDYRLVVNNGTAPMGYQETTAFAGGDPETDSNCVDGVMLVTLVDDTTADLTLDCGFRPFAAPGACCLPDGSCIEVTMDDCTLSGGTFAGPDSECAETNCPQPGACCLPDGTCRLEIVIGGGPCAADGGVYQGDDTTCAESNCIGACCHADGTCTEVELIVCMSRGGLYQGLNVSCAATSCPQPGACCLPDGTCRQDPLINGVFCMFDGGTYQGNDTICATANCPAGACCFDDGSCLDDTSEPDCLTAGGTWSGLGSTCATANCPQPGACCLPNGTCEQQTMIGGSSCVAQGGMYQGDGTTCATTNCPGGACCLDDGSCVANISLPACTLQGGQWAGLNVTCAAADCAQPGACCLINGSCISVPPGGQECINQGGEYQGDGKSCATTLCLPPMGACCNIDGTCSMEVQFNCETKGGIYQGDLTNCGNVVCPPTGACCFDDGSCLDVINSWCVGQGGTFAGDGTSCATFDCPQPPGACCLPTGVCVSVPEEQCDTLGGVFAGDFTLCGDVACAQPGACCLPNGTCRQEPVIGGATCVGDGGVYQGDDTTCAAVSCPAGACCLPDGTCVDDQDEPTCLLSGGQWQGLSTTCAASSCPQPGACCLGDGTCRMETVIGGAQCVADGGTYQGDGTTCGTVQCPGGACCFPTGICTDNRTEPDCVMFGGVWQGLGSTCADANCPQPGACCLPDGSCRQETEIGGGRCLTDGGTYQGDGTLCVDVDCPAGACCLTDGQCLDDTEEADCLAAGGSWQGLGSDCATANCPQPGVCCFADGTCGIDPMIGGAMCTSRGGTYQGDDTTCATVVCPAGACCLTDGTCQDEVTEPDCINAGGTWQGLSSTCVTSNCPTGACCFPDGTCAEQSQPDCTTNGGVWQGVTTTCADVMCPQPGACCLADGSCRMEMLIGGAQCIADGGTYQGDGTDCLTVNCPGGACCFSDGSCQDNVSLADCAGAAGVWQGLGVTCAGAACPQPGACCLPDGTCRIEGVISGFQCLADGGVYQGDGTNCVSSSCPTGACCLVDGSCIALPLADCTATGGQWQGVLVDCATFTCPQPGACCMTDGTCMQSALAGGLDCVGLGGTYQGDDTTCATVTCPQGACCFDDGSCTVQPEPDCENNGGVWQGLGTICGPFSCPPGGACCFVNGQCGFLTQTACLANGGLWNGAGIACQDIVCEQPPTRGNCSEKGSLIVFPKVELRWNAAGQLIQDTFIQLTNDYNNDVQVQLYFINGDPPVDAMGNERAHPGWNWVDVLVPLTGDQSLYWSADTGQPFGVSPFRVLDPGFPPGRPVDPAVPNGERMLRGYVIGWAVNNLGQQIKWNHSAGEAPIVNYERQFAWMYNACTFAVRDDAIAHGAVAGPAGQLILDGQLYDAVPDLLLMNFDASALAQPMPIDSAVVLHPMTVDLRQETAGPVTTKASFEVWNENEVKFSGADRCITCWDCFLLSDFDVPNHFLIENLQTAVGKARIQGLSSQLCHVDFDPSNNDSFPFPPGPGDNVDPRDVVSQAAALIGVRVRYFQFGTTAFGAAGGNLVGMGYEDAAIQYDIMTFPPSSPTEDDDNEPAEADTSFDAWLDSTLRDAKRAR